MTQFEYLSVLVSIILALGLSEVVICWGRIIQHRREVKFSWLHAFWTAFVIFIMIQFWWGFWNFRTVTDWSLPALLALFAETVLVVLAAILLIPGKTFAEGYDLEQIYFDNSRPFFLIGCLMLFFMGSVDGFILGTGLLTTENTVRLISAVAAGGMAFVTSKRVHYLGPFIFTGLMIVFLIIATYL